MIVYGTEIESDRDFLMQYPDDMERRYGLNLIQNPPGDMLEVIVFNRSSAFKQKMHGRIVHFYSDGGFDGIKKGQFFCYEVENVVKFYWASGERTVYYLIDSAGNTSLWCFWFVHLFLPLYYTLENMYEVFHGGAVEVDNKSILFFAPSMGGKSTLTQCFIKQGHSFITDDKILSCKEDGKFLTGNSHPYYRPYRRYEDLGQYAQKHITTFRPIHAAYLLKPVDAKADIVIEEINGQEKFSILLQNCLHRFKFLQKRRLLYVAALLKQIKMYSLSNPWDISRQLEVYEEVCLHNKMESW